jgi:ABC-type branched-subunit amino acid transport system ATPase component
MFDLRNPALASAVSKIQMRAEHETVEESLASIYVDNGLLLRMENRSSQILVGRRGTGKTHLLLALRACPDNPWGTITPECSCTCFPCS